MRRLSLVFSCVLFLGAALCVTAYDLAVTGIKSPKRLPLPSGVPRMTRQVKVTIHNRGTTAMTIPTVDDLAWLVRLHVESLGDCPAADHVLLAPQTFPLVLAVNQKLQVTFDVTFDCANDPLPTSKTQDHSDYRYTVTVDHTALAGEPDTNYRNDDCPRGPGDDDHGCGNKDNASGQLGAEVLTDVVGK